ncbi:Hypothetical protein R9X50_00726800 [Acrodontium crateriforme]|uniref:C2H2-type domain-containing protein n=1 Tax=Acrodontium crateriforme TaxID=150365 RepID=A0AAQ3M9G4_9PEZI|nr:Hypothetical protein R9X50_00726800 [Acrodontium crateriforme]
MNVEIIQNYTHPSHPLDATHNNHQDSHEVIVQQNMPSLAQGNFGLVDPRLQWAEASTQRTGDDDAELTSSTFLNDNVQPRGTRSHKLDSSTHSTTGLLDPEPGPRALSQWVLDQPMQGSSTSPYERWRCYDHECNGKIFSCRENLRRHMREKSKSEYAICKNCLAPFTRKSNRDKHMRDQKCKIVMLF